MKDLFTNDSGKTGWFDHLLATIAGCLVLYCMGNAVSRPEVGSVLVLVFIAGNLFSWLAGSLLANTKVATWDGFFYLVLVGVLFLVAGSLGSVFGENPFLGIFSSVGFLSWMIVFGSFAAWRDSTLLFQAVPCIAIFGLVGCYDTFRSVTFYFFGFLLCIATLFARINARNMLEYAVRSGAGIARPTAEGTPISALRKGPWRSVAGPTWALLSAGIIIVLSLVGAPLVQQSVQGVVGHFRLPIPQVARNARLATPYFRSDQGSVQIGQGPVTLASEPILRIKMDEPRYLRTAVYHNYTGHGWSRNEPTRDSIAQNTAITQMTRSSRDEIENPKMFDFTIEMLTGRGGVLPVPGEPVGVTGNTDAMPSYDGTYSLRPGANLSIPYVGKAISAPDDATWTSAERVVPPSDVPLWTSTGSLPQTVIDLADKVTQGAKDDRAKAEKIKEEIARRIVYDQQAEAVPSGEDPVAYTLLKSHVGYCDIFASSMVLMARAENIPARYVTGFYPFDFARDDAGRFTIRESDAHAWAELYFKGVGWVPYDATEGAVEAEGRGRGESTSGFVWMRSAWFAFLLKALAAIVAAGLVVLLVNRYQDRPYHNVSKERIDRLYLRFNASLAQKTGRRRMPEQTPEEYLRSLETDLGPNFESASAISGQFLASLFGPPAPEDPYAELLRQVRDFEKTARRKV